MAAVAHEPDLADTSTRTSRKLALPAIVFVGAAAIYAVGLFADRPITFPDEAVYADLARHLGTHGTFKVAGSSFPALTFGPLYAVLLAPIFRFAPSAHAAYLGARGLNALLFASSAAPIWLIARRVVAERTALFIAAAGIAMPASVYTTKLQTESVAYPVMLWSVVAALAMLSQPTRGRQIVLVLCVLVAPFVRFELVALGPALAIGCVLCTSGAIGRRLQLLRTMLLGVLMVVAGTGWVLAVSSRGAGPEGTHGSDIHALSFQTFLKWFIGSVGALDLYTGILPFAVFALLLVGGRARQSWANGDVRRIAVLAAWIGLGLTATGSLYLASIPESFQPPLPAERYTFYVVPLIFVVFACWIERGAPRTAWLRWAAPAAGLIPLVVAAAIVDSTDDGNSNSLAFMPWIFVRNLTSGQWWLVALGAFGLLIVVRAVRPRVSVDSLVKPVMTIVAVTTACAFMFVVGGADKAKRNAPPPGWLDAHTESPAVAVWLGAPTAGEAFSLWETDALNRHLARVYYVRRADHFGAEFERKIVRRADGVLLDNGRPLTYRYVLTGSHTRVVGHLVARSGGLSLYRALLPVRMFDGARPVVD